MVAVVVDDIVLIFVDPHGLEGAKGGEDGAGEFAELFFGKAVQVLYCTCKFGVYLI